MAMEGPPQRAAYPSDLRDDEWELIGPHIPPPKPGGRPREVDVREVANAVFYRLKTGCQWRAIPHDFPPWRTVYEYWLEWSRTGLWKTLNDLLRVDLRAAAGRHDEPSAAIIDSQTVKAAEKGGPVVSTRGKRSWAVNVT